MMDKKLSVIIPVHNGAKKITKTAEGILNQSYRNLELILIENGSNDNTWEVCQNIASRDSRCVALQSDKTSTLLARKTGIEYATGEFITFADADDEYNSADSLGNMLQAIIRTGADIVQFGNIVNTFGKKEYRLNVKEELVINREQLLREDIAGAMGAYHQKINLNVWAKIYRAGVLKSIIPELTLPLINAEDLYLNCCAFFSNETQTVAFVPICEYVYNTGIGVSGKGISSAEKMFKEYEYFKFKAMELAKKHEAAEQPIYLSQRETLRFLDALVKSYIIRGDFREEICSKIRDWWKYRHVKLARDYFTDYIKKHELDEEMLRFATETDAEQYYEYCVSRIGNLPKERIRYRIKSLSKDILRLITR